MYLCDKCGATLDPGERCDCEVAVYDNADRKCECWKCEIKGNFVYHEKNIILFILWLFAIIFLLCVFVCTIASAASTGNAVKGEIINSKGEIINSNSEMINSNSENIEADNECVFYLAEYVQVPDKQAEPPCRMQLTDEERYMLARIVMAEAEVEDLKGKALVACVVFNRIEYEPEFESTVKGVVFERGQFSPVRKGGRYWSVEPNEDCYKAVDMVINGWDESCGALYFEGCKSADNWHSRNLKFLFKHGTHRFYK